MARIPFLVGSYVRIEVRLDEEEIEDWEISLETTIVI